MRSGSRLKIGSFFLFHAFRSSVNLNVLKVKINVECLGIFLIGKNNYYRCKQIMCQVYLLQGSGTKIINLPEQNNVLYLLVDYCLCPLRVIS